MKINGDKRGKEDEKAQNGVAIILMTALVWSFGFYMWDHVAVKGGKFTALAEISM